MTGRDDRRDPVAWFDALYRRSYQDVLQYARRRVPAVEADDVVAEVFTTAWRRRDEVATIDRAWLLRAASNYLMHAYRGAARQERLHHKLGQVGLGDARVAETGVDLELTAAMNRLSVGDRELLLLSAWEQLTPRELAAVLGCSPATARVRLHRARRRLADLLTDSRGTAAPTVEMT